MCLDILSMLPVCLYVISVSSLLSYTALQTLHQKTVLIMRFFLGAALRGDSSSPAPNQVLTKRRLQDLLREIDPREQMDDDVEDVS